MKALAETIVFLAVVAFVAWAVWSIGQAKYWKRRALKAERAAEAARLTNHPSQVRDGDHAGPVIIGKDWIDEWNDRGYRD